MRTVDGAWAMMMLQAILVWLPVAGPHWRGLVLYCYQYPLLGKPAPAFPYPFTSPLAHCFTHSHLNSQQEHPQHEAAVPTEHVADVVRTCVYVFVCVCVLWMC